MVLVHTLFRLAETRGYEIVAAEDSWGVFRGVAIAIRGHRYAVKISELTSSIPTSETERERWRKDHPWRTDEDPPPRKSVANGRLKLTFPTFIEGDRSSWSEGPRGSLESKFIRVLDELEARAARDDVRDLERARQERERQRLVREREEHERLERIEEGNRKRLSAEVQAWRRAEEIRDYIAALRKRAISLSEIERARIEGWCDWAEQLASDVDPLQNIEAIPGLNGGDENPPKRDP
ncbi:MAG TPA: hypothetical protein VGB52_01865 [Actinomycetota bacterium]